MPPTKFKVSWPQEKKRKIDFQNGHQGGRLGFPRGMILAMFDLQVTAMLPTKFQVNWLSLGEEAKNRFLDGHQGGHLGFSIRIILAIFDLQVTLMLPTMFQVSWPFGSGEGRSEK